MFEGLHCFYKDTIHKFKDIHHTGGTSIDTHYRKSQIPRPTHQTQGFLGSHPISPVQSMSPPHCSSPSLYHSLDQRPVSLTLAAMTQEFTTRGHQDSNRHPVMLTADS
jgi:hypothetical protein